MADPNFSNVQLLLHFNGTDGATSFTDSSLNSRTIETVGSASLETTGAIFGSASLNLPYAAGGAAYTEDVSGMALDGDFTIEMQYHPAASLSSSAYHTLVDIRTGAGFDTHVAVLYRYADGESDYIGLWINGVDEIIGSTPVGSGAPKHIAWVRYNGVHKVYLAGVSQGSYTSSSTITPYAVAFGAVVEDDSSFFDQAYGLIDELRWRDAAEYTSDFTPPSAEFEEGDSWEGYAAAATPLGAPVAQGGTLYGFVAVPSIFGSVALTGSSTNGFVSVGSPLSGELVLGRHDFSAAVANWQITYEMDLITPDGPVTVPISSWQATLQTDAQSYLGCVIPACTAWLDTLEVATDFRIRRVARQGTQVAESEMASASLDTSQLDQGPTNYTASINGYSAAFDVVEEPEAVYDRVLTGIRSISSYSSGATRVRCEIDWLLRPSQRAWIDDNTSFVVSYINYYVPTGGDAYMDVGARP